MIIHHRITRPTVPFYIPKDIKDIVNSTNKKVVTNELLLDKNTAIDKELRKSCAVGPFTKDGTYKIPFAPASDGIMYITINNGKKSATYDGVEVSAEQFEETKKALNRERDALNKQRDSLNNTTSPHVIKRYLDNEIDFSEKLLTIPFVPAELYREVTKEEEDKKREIFNKRMRDGNYKPALSNTWEPNEKYYRFSINATDGVSMLIYSPSGNLFKFEETYNSEFGIIRKLITVSPNEVLYHRGAKEAFWNRKNSAFRRGGKRKRRKTKKVLPA